MKTILQVLIILCITLISQYAYSQNTDRFPPMRERIFNAKFDEICRRMELDKTIADRLRPVYRNFEKEKTPLMSDNRGGGFAYRDSTLSEQQQDEIYLKTLDRAKKMVELREAFYPKLRTVLTPRQVVQLNRIEMDLNRRMMQQLKKRMNERNSLKE